MKRRKILVFATCALSFFAVSPQAHAFSLGEFLGGTENNSATQKMGIDDLKKAAAEGDLRRINQWLQQEVPGGANATKAEIIIPIAYDYIDSNPAVTRALYNGVWRYSYETVDYITSLIKSNKSSELLPKLIKVYIAADSYCKNDLPEVLRCIVAYDRKDLIPSLENINTRLKYSSSTLDLLCACLINDTDRVSQLIKLGIDINKQDPIQPLSIACGLGYYKLANLLLKSGAEVTSTWAFGAPSHEKTQNWEPMLYACNSGKLDLVKLISEKYLEKHLKEYNQPNTPLSLAASNNHLDVVKYLLDKGVSPDGDGRFVPIIYAARTNNLDLLRLLSKYSIDYCIKDGSNDAAEIALSLNNIKFAELLAACKENVPQNIHRIESDSEKKQRIQKLREEKSEKEMSARIEKQWSGLFLDVLKRNTSGAQSVYDSFSEDDLLGQLDKSINYMQSNLIKKIGKPVYVRVQYESPVVGGFIGHPFSSTEIVNDRICVIGKLPKLLIKGESVTLVGVISGSYQYSTVIGATNSVPKITAQWIIGCE